jgi:hypothetical protein
MTIRNDLHRLFHALPIIALAYLVGLLTNDLVFDVSPREIVTGTYYCELLSSFSTIFGLLRIVGPATLCGIMQLYVFHSERGTIAGKSQAFVLVHLLLVGIPLMAVSLSLCQRECATFPQTNTWTIGREILTIHVLMLVLFLISLCVQIKIAYSSSEP